MYRAMSFIALMLSANLASSFALDMRPLLTDIPLEPWVHGAVAVLSVWCAIRIAIWGTEARKKEVSDD